MQEHFAGRLDQAVFPYVKDAPIVAASKDSRGSGTPQTTASLRSLRADWATKGRKVQNEPRQRVIVFIAGGATYSEVRAVYKVSEATNKDVFLGALSLLAKTVGENADQKTVQARRQSSQIGRAHV